MRRNLAKLIYLVGASFLLVYCMPLVSQQLPVDAARVLLPTPKEPVQITVWSGRPLPETLLTEARAIPGVLAAGTRVSQLVDLRSVTGADKPLSPRPQGAVLPVQVSTLDAGVLEALHGLRPAVEALRRGEVVMPRSSAEFRGLGLGDSVELGPGTFAIGAIVDDSSGYRGEFIVSDAAAQALGLNQARALVLAVDADAATATEARLQSLIGQLPIRLRYGSGGGRSSRRLLPLLDAKQVFGEFWYRPLSGARIAPDPAWVRQNIVEARVPLLGTFRCHKRIIPQLRGAMNELQSRDLGRLVTTNDGCYSPRMQTTNEDAISRHAFGAAIDINAATNAQGAVPTMDPALVEVMEKWGFAWGGRWTVPDGMHFEFVRFPDEL